MSLPTSRIQQILHQIKTPQLATQNRQEGRSACKRTYLIGRRGSDGGKRMSSTRAIMQPANWVSLIKRLGGSTICGKSDASGELTARPYLRVIGRHRPDPIPTPFPNPDPPKPPPDPFQIRRNRRYHRVRRRLSALSVRRAQLADTGASSDVAPVRLPVRMCLSQ